MPDAVVLRAVVVRAAAGSEQRRSGSQALRRLLGRRGVLRLLGLLLPVLAFSGVPSAVWAQSGDVGYQGPSHSGTGTPTGTKRAESVLWWNDGSWWAHMWDTASQDFHIFRLDAATQSWVDTGVLVDPRANTHADVLWDGTHLNVSSHRFVNDGDPAVAGVPGYLYRFSYSGGTYSLDAGFPAAINDYKTETLSIDRDSTGKLWATWQQDNQIYVNHTTGGDSSWGTPFVLPTGVGGHGRRQLRPDRLRRTDRRACGATRPPTTRACTSAATWTVTRTPPGRRHRRRCRARVLGTTT